MNLNILNKKSEVAITAITTTNLLLPLMGVVNSSSKLLTSLPPRVRQSNVAGRLQIQIQDGRSSTRGRGMPCYTGRHSYIANYLC